MILRSPALTFAILTLLFSLTACSPGPSSDFQVATQGLISGAIASDGSGAVVASVHHGGSYWDLTKKERLYNWNHKAEGFSLLRASDVSGNGKRAVTTEENTLVLWETASGKSLQFSSTPARILNIKLNWKGDKALIGLNNGQAVYFNLDRGNAIHTFEHSAEIRSVDMDKDGKIGITGSDDFSAKIWDLKTGKLLETRTLENAVKTVAISPSGKLAFVTAQREDTVVWDTASGKAKFSSPNRYINYTAAEFSEDEKTIVLGTFQGAVIKLSTSSGKELSKWQAKPRQAYGSATSKSIIDVAVVGKTIMAITSDGQIQTFK